MTFTPRVKRVNVDEQQQLKQALNLLKEKRFDEAITQFTAIIQANPTSKKANLGAAIAHFHQRQYDQAIAYFETVMRLDPLSPQAPLGLGKIYLRQGNLEKAAEKLVDAINLAPKLAQAYVIMGRVFVKQKQYPEAIQQLKKALLLDPRIISARLNLAQAYVKQNSLQAAVAELKTAVNIAPQSWLSYLQLGRVYLQQQEQESAETALLTATKNIGAAPPFTLLQLTKALVDANLLVQASEILLSIPKSPQSAPIIHKLWGDLYHRQGLFKEATEEYRSASVLASSANISVDELDNFDSLNDSSGEDWEELADSFRESATTLLSEQSSRRRLGR